MPPIPGHCNWFEDTGTVLRTSDGKDVRVFRFNYQEDDALLNAWAEHFRKNYCSDQDLDALCAASGMTRLEYLRDVVFPSTTAPGPSVRSGDFSEILVADYIQFLMGYTVPRTRYDRKDSRDSSSKSIDVLGFKFIDPDAPGDNDELLTCEVKASLTAPASNNLQDAVEGATRDFETRLPFALNAAYLRLRDRGEVETAAALERFMNKVARPYRNISGAVLLCTDAGWNDTLITESSAEHLNPHLVLFAFRGNDLMNLTNRLYEIAYATA